ATDWGGPRRRGRPPAPPTTSMATGAARSRSAGRRVRAAGKGGPRRARDDRPSSRSNRRPGPPCSSFERIAAERVQGPGARTGRIRDRGIAHSKRVAERGTAPCLAAATRRGRTDLLLGLAGLHMVGLGGTHDLRGDTACGGVFLHVLHHLGLGFDKAREELAKLLRGYA